MFLYIGVWILVYEVEHKAMTMEVITSPSLPIYKMQGKAKETLLLSPTLEQEYKTSNFVLPKAGFGIAIYPSKKIGLVNTGNKIPIFIQKYNNTFSYMYIDPYSGKTSYAHNGKVIDYFPNLDMHDVINHQNESITFLEYIFDPTYIDDLGFRPIHLGIKKIDKNNRILWSWNSKNHINPKYFIQQPERPAQEKNIDTREKVIRTRRAYSSFLYKQLGINIFSKISETRISLGGKTTNLFDRLFDTLDYVHGNSIQYLENDKYILVSARNLDTVFIIDVKTGSIIWSLGGPYSSFTKNRVVGDPRGGFSHQHDAKVYNNKLYLFDNGNMRTDLPSRAVVYTFDFKNPSRCRFLYEYLEPYGRQRLSMGSIEPLDKDRILIGWGGVPVGPDRLKPSAAASIVNIENNRSEFQIDFLKGWTSYRVRKYLY